MLLSQVLWQNGDRKVLSLKKKVYSGDRRMHVVHNSPKEWSLRIAGVTREDLGVYTCVVNTAPFLTRTVHLTHASDSTGPESQGGNSGWRSWVWGKGEETNARKHIHQHTHTNTHNNADGVDAVVDCIAPSHMNLE